MFKSAAKHQNCVASPKPCWYSSQLRAWVFFAAMGNAPLVLSNCLGFDSSEIPMFIQVEPWNLRVSPLQCPSCMMSVEVWKTTTWKPWKSRDFRCNRSETLSTPSIYSHLCVCIYVYIYIYIYLSICATFTSTLRSPTKDLCLGLF